MVFIVLFSPHASIITGCFDQALERREQLGAERAIDRAVVAVSVTVMNWPVLTCALVGIDALLAGADREDGRRAAG